MSVTDSNNPAYIAIVNLFGVYHVNRMDYDPKQDSYVVSVSKQVKDIDSAYIVGAEWAKRDGLEIR